MRFYRNLIVLGVAFLILLFAYIFIGDRGKDNLGQDVNKGITLKKISIDNISEIKLKNGNGQIALLRQGKGWKMIAPSDYKLDELLLGGFIKKVSAMKAQGKIEDNPGNLEQYGLKNPNSVLSVKEKNGITTLFMLGDQLPFGEDYYLKTSDGSTLYYVDSTTAGDLLRSASEFRDKTILSLSPDYVTYLAVSKAGNELFRFKRNGSEWEVTSAEGAKKGDKTAIENVINILSNLKARDFELSLYSKPSDYGFDNNSYSILIGTKIQPEIKISVGNEKDETSTYVMKEASNDIFVVYKADVGVVTKTAKDFTIGK